ncbi:hypothetical protein D3C87_1160790 [compost metagenome]
MLSGVLSIRTGFSNSLTSPFLETATIASLARAFLTFLSINCTVPETSFMSTFPLWDLFNWIFDFSVESLELSSLNSSSPDLTVSVAPLATSLTKLP